MKVEEGRNRRVAEAVQNTEEKAGEVDRERERREGRRERVGRRVGTTGRQAGTGRRR